MRLAPAVSAAALLCAAPALAWAHPVDARLTPSGLEFLERQLPTYVPAHVSLPPIDKAFYTCSDGQQITLTQRATDVDLALEALDLSLPAAGKLRADVTLSAWARGEAYLDNIYFCHGAVTCDDTLTVLGARAVIDFDVTIDAAGQPRVTIASLDLQVTPDDVDFRLSGCAIDDLVNYVIDAGKGVGLDILRGRVQALAQEQIAPKLEEVLAGFVSYETSLLAIDARARLTSVAISPAGIGLAGDVDLASPFPAAACLPADPGEPAAHAGPAPDLGEGAPAHVAVDVNLGLVDDALYQVWREGLMCMTPDTLRALGVDLDLSLVGDLLPGFPDGTEWSLFVLVGEPPRARASEGDTATLTLTLAGVAADLVAHLPDGTSRRLHVEMDASATARALVDPTVNALTLDVVEAHLTRLVVDDGVGAASLGFDYGRLHKLLEDHLLPRLASELTRVPVTGPIFGGLADYYVILRELRTSAAYLVARADLFRAPADDRSVPETFIAAQPDRVVSPANARVLLDGRDADVPAELLRFRVSIDGVDDGTATHVRRVDVGEAGRSATYRIEARAVDLAGNTDATPAVAEVTVDGVRPVVRIEDGLSGVLPTGSVSFRWAAADDLTAPERLAPSVRVYRVPDRDELGGGTLVGEAALAPGATEVRLDLESGAQYQVVLAVADEAGNAGQASMVFTVAAEAGGCACRAAAGGGTTRSGSALVLLSVAAGWALRRRRAARGR